MRRVASLYLPNLPIDRLRRNRLPRQPDLRSPPREPRPPSLQANGTKHPQEGTRIEDCSCPRGGGWRPGARWSRAEIEAAIEALPLHQRPLMRQLGRRTEAAEVPFRARWKQEPADAGAPDTGNSLPPLVTTHRLGQRVVVAAACPAAQALGLQPGMADTQARAMVPGLELREADPQGDELLLGRLGLFAARRWTPFAALSGPDGLWLDLGGVSHLFGGEQAMCARIIRFCARLGLGACIAIAGTPGAAHALARHSGRPITFCRNGAEAEALAGLPVSALRIDGDVLNAARRLGIDRIGDLLSMPRGPLRRRFGETLLARLDQALGRSAEPFDPIVPEESPSASLRMAEPIATAEAITHALGMLMAELIGRLERAGLAARGLSLVCERIDGVEQSIEIGTARATRDSVHLQRLLAMKIERIEPGFGIEAMHLVAVRAEPLAPQPLPSALGGDTPAPDLVPLIDRLAGRLGNHRLFRTSAVESDVPERSLCRVSPLGEVAAWPREWSRPVRLLSPPERVENVVALLPDHPPRRFTWRGRAYAIARGDGPERIHGEWWRRTGEADAVRDYFQVEDDQGARFWLYRRGDGVDARTGDLSWYMHGMFG